MGRFLKEPARVTLEIAVSKRTGRILLRVESSGIEQIYAEGVKELVVDLGREDVLVFREGHEMERRKR